jgi:hypothetical protein
MVRLLFKGHPPPDFAVVFQLSLWRKRLIPLQGRARSFFLIGQTHTFAAHRACILFLQKGCSTSRCGRADWFTLCAARHTEIIGRRA